MGITPKREKSNPQKSNPVSTLVDITLPILQNKNYIVTYLNILYWGDPLVGNFLIPPRTIYFKNTSSHKIHNTRYITIQSAFLFHPNLLGTFLHQHLDPCKIETCAFAIIDSFTLTASL